ncbi:MAG: lysophospholipid acyltransferase family protein [Candidatus Dormibacteria bacterium]
MLAAALPASARLVKLLPAPVRYALAGAGGSAFYALNRRRRRIARANYAAVLDLPETHPEVGRLARAAYANYGRVLADFLLVSALRADQVRDLVSLHGREHLDRALARGRGVVLVAAHLGNWDVAGALAGALGYRITAVADGFGGGAVERFVISTRLRHNLEIVPIGASALRSILRTLAQGGIAALICDLEHGPGQEVEFFRRLAVVPAGPAQISIRTGAPIVPVQVTRLADGHYRVDVEPVLPAGSDATELAQQVVRRFEAQIRMTPDQWYVFRPMWKGPHPGVASARPA